MQPLNISVSVELTVSEQLKSLLSGLFQGHKTLPETPATKQKDNAKAVKAPAQVVTAPAETVAAPAETVAEVSDEVLRQAVREAKSRASVPEIREVFRQFGIEASSECPSERRAELKKSLDQLGI